MKRKIFLPLLSMALLAFAIYHVVVAQQTPSQLPPLNDPAMNRFARTIAGAGVIEPRSENIYIGSSLPGVVEEVYVKAKDRVWGPSWFYPGSPLFRLDRRQLEAELAVRRANLLASRAALTKLERMPRPEEIPPVEARVREAEVMLNDARDQYNRARELVRTRAVGEEEVTRKRNAVAAAEAQLARAEAELRLLKKGAWEYEIMIAKANLAQAEASVQQTETELGRLVVRASIDGTVLQCNVHPGEYVGIPPGQALIVLGDMSELHVRMDVDESDIPRFQPGMRGKATPRGNAQGEFQLRFVRVEPFVVPKKTLTGSGAERVDTRVLQLIYAIEPTPMPLYVGQQVDVFLDASAEDR